MARVVGNASGGPIHVQDEAHSHKDAMIRVSVALFVSSFAFDHGFMRNFYFPNVQVLPI